MNILTLLKSLGVIILAIAGIVTLLVAIYLSYMFVVVAALSVCIYLVYLFIRAIESP